LYHDDVVTGGRPGQSSTSSLLLQSHGRRRLHAWLIHMGEMLQSDGPGTRLWRYGLLAGVLDAGGDRVTRWAPTFIPYDRRQRASHDVTVSVSDRHEIRLIHARGYSRNIGVARVRFHREVAQRWELLQRSLPPPDVILCGMPTAEICSAARRIGRERNVPVVIDVRDVQPDALISLAPQWAAGPMRLLFWPMHLVNRRNFASASAISAISETYLRWGLNRASRVAGPLDRVFPMGYAPPEAVDADVHDATEKWKQILVPGRFRSLFLGVMGSTVDLLTVVRAAHVLEARSPGRFEWIFGGDGPARSAAEEAARELTNVHFPGWVGGAEVRALLTCANVGLAAYRRDAPISLPNKPFEYAWAALPVASSLTGEFARLLEHEQFGTSYAASDAQGLAAIVEEYERDPALAKTHGANGRSLWETRFASDTVYEDMAEYLRGVAAAA
jgi:glycosyltransferase involved in cell wall biosynthesis